MEVVRMLLLVMSKIGQRYDVIIVVSRKTTIFLPLGRIHTQIKILSLSTHTFETKANVPVEYQNKSFQSICCNLCPKMEGYDIVTIVL